jgi:hypothetical protein
MWASHFHTRTFAASADFSLDGSFAARSAENFAVRSAGFSPDRSIVARNAGLSLDPPDRSIAVRSAGFSPESIVARSAGFSPESIVARSAGFSPDGSIVARSAGFSPDRSGATTGMRVIPMPVMAIMNTECY